MITKNILLRKIADLADWTRINAESAKLKTILLIVLGAMLVAAPALAATNVTLSPASVNVRPNQDFSVTVAVNPQGVKNYTVSVELNFPANLMQLKSFNFADGWTPLSQPGYNTVDNTNGILVKTAGYTSGFSEAIVFGTAVFTSKQNGAGTIDLNTVKSQALDGIGSNVISTAVVQVAVAVASASVVTPPAQTPPAQVPPVTTLPVVTPPTGSETEQPTGEDEEVTETEVDQALATPQVLLAQISELITLGTGDNAIGVLVVAVVVVVIYLIYSAIRRMSTKAKKEVEKENKNEKE